MMCATGKEEWGGTWGGAGKKKKKEKADSYTLGKTDQRSKCTSKENSSKGKPPKRKEQREKGNT
jgi:hypothetical protein